MRTNEWYVSPVITLVSFLGLSLLADFRLPLIVLFSFGFASIIARDEWRPGRTLLRTIIPLLVSVVLLFVVALFSSVLRGDSPLQSNQASLAAYGCLVLISLCLIVGIPLAWAGALTRNYPFYPLRSPA